VQRGQDPAPAHVEGRDLDPETDKASDLNWDYEFRAVLKTRELVAQEIEKIPRNPPGGLTLLGRDGALHLHVCVFATATRLLGVVASKSEASLRRRRGRHCASSSSCEGYRNHVSTGFDGSQRGSNARVRALGKPTWAFTTAATRRVRPVALSRPRSVAS
jgi:hypothetical protein